MTREDIEQKIADIKTAIKKKEYKIYYDGPNNIREHEAPDGSTFYVVYDMDDAKSSTYFGSNEIEIAGESFSCELEWGEWESDYFNQIEEEYGEDDADDYIEEIKDIISDIDGFLAGEYKEMDDQIAAYELMNNCSIDSYYWYEDNERPMDACDFEPIESVCDETIDFGGKTYYVVEGDLDDDGIVAVPSDADPDCYGCYETVILVVKNGEVVDVEDNDQMFNSTENELD